MFMQVRSFAFWKILSQLKWVLEKQVVLTTWWYQLWGTRGGDANDLEVGLLQSSHKVAVTYTSGDTLPDFFTSKLFTDDCIFISSSSYHRTCYGANPPELNSALHT